MSKIEIKKVCQFCGKEFIAHKLNTMYCSHQCSQRSYKVRLREQKLEKVVHQENFPDITPTKLKKEYLSCEDVAELMGVSSTTVYRYCVTGKMNCIRMNRKIFIRRADIDALFQFHVPYQVRRVIAKPKEDYYTVEEIKEKYSVSKDTIFKYATSRNIPRVKHGNKTYFSKKHIDSRFSLFTPDPDISEWYTVEDICQKYDMTVHAVHGCVSNSMVPRMRHKGVTYYSKNDVDEVLKHRIPDPNITEWYSMEDIGNIYGLAPHYVSGLLYKNPIPKMKKGNKGYYSKIHFDQLMKEKFPQPEYYTVDDALSQFNIGREALYKLIKRYSVTTIKEGRSMKIAKQELDLVMSNKKRTK